jgi:hypothetical protein
MNRTAGEATAGAPQIGERRDRLEGSQFAETPISGEPYIDHNGCGTAAIAGSALGLSTATEHLVFGRVSGILAARSRRVWPYLIGGLGMYRVSVTGYVHDRYMPGPTYPISEKQTGLGWHAGAGLSFPSAGPESSSKPATPRLGLLIGCR